MINRDIVFAVARRPRLWGTAVGSALAFAPTGWWRHRPFLPFPDDAVMRWRTATEYGTAEAVAKPADVVAYLEWRRRSAKE